MRELSFDEAGFKPMSFDKLIRNIRLCYEAKVGMLRTIMSGTAAASLCILRLRAGMGSPGSDAMLHDVVQALPVCFLILSFFR